MGKLHAIASRDAAADNSELGKKKTPHHNSTRYNAEILQEVIFKTLKA